MQIVKDKVVEFHYQLRDIEADIIVERSYGGDPVACLIGHRNIIDGLEQAMLGKSAGDRLTVALQPEQAYGTRKEGSKQRIPIKHLMTKGKLKPGMVVHVQTDQGARQVVVEKVGKFNVDVDTNHPLAGKALEFDIEIIDVRDATAEEISHRHAHGAGGHHH
jgi:FKBP-type peptidyl-prolyl cis-trans isomerase SlyD